MLINYASDNGIATNVAGQGLNVLTASFDNTYRGAEIRGWKYGLANALPQFTKAYFRPNSFGQVRDMLEQRLDTKFYETQGYKPDGNLGGAIGEQSSPVQVRFINSQKQLTLPALTFSSNLSYEATSSLPYFDGVVRNREEPLNVSSINLSVI